MPRESGSLCLELTSFPCLLLHKNIPSLMLSTSVWILDGSLKTSVWGKAVMLSTLASSVMNSPELSGPRMAHEEYNIQLEHP